MCGVAGIANLSAEEPPPRAALERMLGALAHRGPDGFGIYRDERVGLAHARLSIIDLEGGHQPMASPDGAVWVTFNGELFNYREIRAALAAEGYALETESDTEVFAAAYAAWGEHALERMSGQWAAALWRPRERELALVRDPLGIRPLYTAKARGRLLFASEIKAIFAAEPELSRDFDPEGIDDIFTFWGPVAPRTAFSAVREIEPGHIYSYGARGARARAYSTPRFDEAGAFASPAESAARVSGALERATRARLFCADVPVGCYLSGGLDSALIAALASEVRGEPVDTFSIRFEDEELDEGRYQREAARALGSRHTEVAVGRRDIAEALPAVVRHAERPILRAAPAPLFLLSERVRDEGIKVVLTGEGADEIFAGYDLFREGAVRRYWARAPHSAQRPRLLGRLYPYMSRSPVESEALARRFFGQGLDGWREPGFAHGPRWRATAALKRLLSPELREGARGRDAAAEILATAPAELASWSHLAQDQYLELRTLLSGYLLSAQGDRMLMAHSVEGRFPFLDRGVVELAGSLPASHKLRGLDEKHVLKRAAAGRIPPSIARRKKQPYRAPDASALAGADAPAWVGELLGPDCLRQAGVLAPDPVTRLWRKCRARGGRELSNSDNMALVGALTMQLLWAELAREPPRPPPPPKLTRDVDRVGDRLVDRGL